MIMKISSRLHPEQIFLNVMFPEKEGLLRFAADIFARRGIVRDAARLYAGMKQREEVMSTGTGNGIGIPHTVSAEAEDAAIVLIRLAQPIDFQALDGLPVDVFLVLVVPEHDTALHLQILAGFSRLCRDPRFLGVVRQAQDSKVLLEAIRSMEDEVASH